jgi:flagellar biosynthesis protein FlhG
VGGGKGGIGKSTVAAGIACQLSNLKKEVILVDADLSGANLHLSMGIRYPEKGLNDFISGTVQDLSDIIINTSYPNVRLISGAGSQPEITNLRLLQKQKLLTLLKSLSADYVVIDVGAGADQDNTDFFSLSNHGIVIITNEPSSVENAFSFLKNSILRKFLRLSALNEKLRESILTLSNPKKGGVNRIPELLERIGAIDPECTKSLLEAHRSFRPCLVVNMVRSKFDVQVEANFRAIVKSYLGIHLAYIGYIVYDETVPASVRKIVPLSASSEAPSVRCLSAITRNLVALGMPNG